MQVHLAFEITTNRTCDQARHTHLSSNSLTQRVVSTTRSVNSDPPNASTDIDTSRFAAMGRCTSP